MPHRTKTVLITLAALALLAVMPTAATAAMNISATVAPATVLVNGLGISPPVELTVSGTIEANTPTLLEDAIVESSQGCPAHPTNQLTYGTIYAPISLPATYMLPAERVGNYRVCVYLLAIKYGSGTEPHPPTILATAEAQYVVQSPPARPPSSPI